MTSTELAAASAVMLGSTLAEAVYIGDTLVWLLQTTPVGRLPQGYTELEYIKSDTNLYIDLNIKLYETLNTDYDIAIKFKCIGTGSDNNSLATLFSCLNNSSPWPGTFIRKYNNLVRGRYIGGSAKDNDIREFNLIGELPVLTAPNKNVSNLNNSGQTHSFGTSLFCAFSDANNTPYRFIQAELYYFKLFVNGTLTRDMVPCTNPNNVVGLYDLVNNVFYSSPNGAAFIAGPPVVATSSPLPYITNGLIFCLDGINKGTGADWVDLIGNKQFTAYGTGITSQSNSYLIDLTNNDSYFEWSGTLFNEQEYTVEVCMYPTRSNTYYVFGGGQRNSYHPLFYYNGSITWGQDNNVYTGTSLASGSKYTVSVNNDRIMKNGVVSTSKGGTDYWDIVSDSSRIRIAKGSTGGALNNPFGGYLYSIRIYNRKLTEAEQRLNQIADNNRFLLGLTIAQQ